MTYKSLTAAVVKEVSIMIQLTFLGKTQDPLLQSLVSKKKKKKSHEKNFIDIPFSCCLRQTKICMVFL